VNLDEELRTTLVSEAWRQQPPGVDVRAILAGGRRRRRRRTALQAGAAAAVVAVIGMSALGLVKSEWTSSLPAIRPTPTAIVAPAPIARVLPDWDCGESVCLDAGTYRVALGIGDTGRALSGELHVPWDDWASDGFAHRVWKESGAGSVLLSVYELRAVAGPQPCDVNEIVDLGPAATVNDVVGGLSNLPQFTLAEAPSVLPAFGRETIHLRIQADRLRCEPSIPGAQYQLAGIYGGDGLGTYGNLLPTRSEGESTIEPGPRVVIDLWVFDLDGQNIVVEARQEGSPTATTLQQLDKVRRSVRFVSE